VSTRACGPHPSARLPREKALLRVLYLLIVIAGSIACLACPFIVGFALSSEHPALGTLSGALTGAMCWPLVYFQITWIPDVLRRLYRFGV
jgi:hypothetical protein